MQVQQLAENHINVYLVKGFAIINSQEISVAATLSFSRNELDHVNEVVCCRAAFPVAN